MSWGADTHVYRAASDFRETFPRRRRARRARARAAAWHGGRGVSKVERVDDKTLVIQRAAGGAEPARTTLVEFLDVCEQYFDGAGSIVEQPYQERLPEGMRRVYRTHDRVVDVTQRYPRGLVTPETEIPPSAKVFEPPEASAFQDLRERADTEYVPEMRRTSASSPTSCRRSGISTFSTARRTGDGNDTLQELFRPVDALGISAKPRQRAGSCIKSQGARSNNSRSWCHNCDRATGRLRLGDWVGARRFLRESSCFQLSRAVASLRLLRSRW